MGAGRLTPGPMIDQPGETRGDQGRPPWSPGECLCEHASLTVPDGACVAALRAEAAKLWQEDPGKGGPLLF